MPLFLCPLFIFVYVMNTSARFFSRIFHKNLILCIILDIYVLWHGYGLVQTKL